MSKFYRISDTSIRIRHIPIIGMALPSTYNMAQAVQDYLQLCNIFQYHILNLTSRINNSYFSNKRWVEGLKLFISVSPIFYYKKVLSMLKFKIFVSSSVINDVNIVEVKYSSPEIKYRYLQVSHVYLTQILNNFFVLRTNCLPNF